MHTTPEKQTTPALNSSKLWSATPTPLTPDYEIDEESLARAVEWQHSLGIEGLFVAGTCGEGALLTDSQTDLLTRRTVEMAAGRMKVSVQVTDNSVARVLDRIERAKTCGADMVTVAPRLFERFATPNSMRRFYWDILESSPLPVCIYQLPTPTILPAEFIDEVYMHPNLQMIKDSTGNAERQKMIFAVAAKRPSLLVLTGVEIGYYADFIRGFQGGLLGSAILNARWARGMHEAIQAEDHDLARAISAHIDDFLYQIFGGPSVKSWMGGLKTCLQKMGLFTHTTSHFDMPPDAKTIEAIEKLVAERFWEFDLDKLRAPVATQVK